MRVISLEDPIKRRFGRQTIRFQDFESQRLMPVPMKRMLVLREVFHIHTISESFSA